MVLDSVAIFARMSCEVQVDPRGERVACQRTLGFLDSSKVFGILGAFPRSGISVTIDGRAVPVTEGSFIGADPERDRCGTHFPVSELSIVGTSPDSQFILELRQGERRRSFSVGFSYDTAADPRASIESTDSVLTVRMSVPPSARLFQLQLVTRRGNVDLLPLRGPSDSETYAVRFSDAEPFLQPTDSSTLARETFRVQARFQGRAARSVAAGDTTFGLTGWRAELDSVTLGRILAFRWRFCTNCR